MGHERSLRGVSGGRNREKFSFRTAAIALAVVAFAWGAMGLATLAQAWRGAAHPYLIPCGALMIFAGVWQGMLLHRALKFGKGLWSPARFIVFVGPWLFLGTLVSYVLALASGPEEEACHVYRAVLAVWYTAGLWPWLRAANQNDHAVRGMERGPWLLRVAAVCGLLVVATEMSLRFNEWRTDRRAEKIATLSRAKLPAGSAFRGGVVNALGYWDQEFVRARLADQFRVAVMGHGLTLSGDSETNCLTQMERRVKGLEVYNFGVATAHPRDYAAHFSTEIVRYQPDLVLAVICVGEDLTFRAPIRGPYDWQSLRLAGSAARWLGMSPLAPAANAWSDVAEDDFEGYLRLVSPQLAVCRKPIDEPMQQQWNRVLRHLGQFLSDSRELRVPVGLVLVPGEFQIRPDLCETLARRAGCSPSQIDVDLPHRRLAQFAQERDVPLLDLLPYFRVSCESPYCRNRPELNEVGHQIAAAVIGSWLQSRRANFLASSADGNVVRR